MPNKRFAALAVFTASMASYFACNKDTGQTPAEQPQINKSPVGVELTSINWKRDWNTAVAEAASSDKLVMIDFYTTWCGPCKLLDKNTFPNSLVVKAASQLVALKQDAEKEGRMLAKEYGIRAYPTILFVDSNGRVKGRLESYYGPEELAEQIQRMINEYNKSRGKT